MNKQQIENKESKYAKKYLKRKRISRKLGYNRVLTIPELKAIGEWR
ncbi:MAG: hypothetical protein R3321_11635 [Nitrososphaeraceae archaeon]|nr:hypothetical protein [Nitrososphaeraceae archaeon]